MDSFLLHQLKSPAKAVQNLETILKSSCQAPDTVEPREIKCLSDSEDNENSRAAIRRNDVRYFADWAQVLIISIISSSNPPFVSSGPFFALFSP